MILKKDKNCVRKVRHRRMRNTLVGTRERPRLNIYRSLNHIYAQIIDDEIGSTLVSSSTMDSSLKGKLDGKSKCDAAKLMGSLLGERAKDKGITKVVFDRGGYLYTGRVAKVAEGAREAGLDF